MDVPHTHSLKPSALNSEYELLYTFSVELYELIENFYPALMQQQYTETIHMISKFYCLWIDSDRLAGINNYTLLEPLVGNALASFAMLALSCQIAWITHYSVNCTNGLVMLSLSLGIKFTTPSFITFGALNNGIFKYSLFNRRAAFKYSSSNRR